MRLATVETAEGRQRYVVLDEAGVIVEPVTRYLKHLDLRGYARNTLRSYGTGLQLFFTFLREQELVPDQVTLDDMGRFVHWLKLPYGSLQIVPGHSVEQARSNRTINHVLTVISGFYDYLWRIDHITSDKHDSTHRNLPVQARTYKRFLNHLAQETPVEQHLLKQPEPKQRPQTLTKQQIEQLIAACLTQRDRLLLRLLFESGMRIGEVLALWLEDIDITRYRLRVCNRGELANGAEIKTSAAERNLDVSSDLIYHIMDYVAVAHTETVTTNHVFLKQHGPSLGEPLTYGDVHALFRRLEQRTGIAAMPHIFRHTLLTLLAKAGWAPEHLRERAGHASFQHTYQLYVHPSSDDLHEAWMQVQSHIQLDIKQEVD